MSSFNDSLELNSFGRKIRCALAHDHVLLRQGLRRLLEDEHDVEVISEAGNAAECLRKAYELAPDVLLADAAIFGLSEVEAQHLVSGESQRTKVLLMSAYDESGRKTTAAELITMLRNAFSGAARLGSDETHSADQSSTMERFDFPAQAALHPDSAPSPITELRERPLTVREKEVLKLLAEGKTVRAAATVLGLSNKTVDAHKFNLMRKLGIHNKAELVMWAIKKRVVKIPVNF